MKRKISVIGLGLIGGSLAMALQGFEQFEIVGWDVSQPTLRYAREHHICDRVAADAVQAVRDADVVYLCMHPKGITDFLTNHAGDFTPGTLVSDVCGIKGAVMDAATALPPGVDFIGSHPMAGTEFSGIEHAFPDLFHGAHYIMTPRTDSTPEHKALLGRIATHIGCRDVVDTTPEEHDAIIAYTSQMMHIIAVAVCDDDGLFNCRGFEGSSFRGCTRVAALDVGLWTQLFSMNEKALSAALDQLATHLDAYRAVLKSGDTKALAEKLAYSADRKRKMDLE